MVRRHQHRLAVSFKLILKSRPSPSRRGRRCHGCRRAAPGTLACSSPGSRCWGVCLKTPKTPPKGGIRLTLGCVHQSACDEHGPENRRHGTRHVRGGKERRNTREIVNRQSPSQDHVAAPRSPSTCPGLQTDVNWPRRRETPISDQHVSDVGKAAI